MPSTHRINAIIAYKDGSISSYTSANQGDVVLLSQTVFSQTEAEVFSWPSFRSFMESIDSLSLSAPIDVSHIEDIAWSVAIDDGTGKQVIGGFKAKGGSGTNSNTVYSSSTFPNFDTAITDQLGTTATATATMRPVGVPVTVARGVGYSGSSILTIVGGTTANGSVQIDVSLLSTVPGQDEADYGGGENNGTFVAGTGYSASDTIALSDGSVITVDAVGTAGDVTQFTVTSQSITGSANFATLTQSSTSGGGTGYTLTQRLLNQGIFSGTYVQTAEVPNGAYSALPADPVSTTGGGGTGATFNVDWGVRLVTVTAGGEGYSSPPAVSFSGGAGTSATAVLTGDAVTSVTVAIPGSGYSATAVVTIASP